MRRKTRKALRLSAHHASVALQMLIEEGKIAAADVTRALQRREKLILEMRARLAALESASAPTIRRVARATRKATRRAVRRAAPKARKAITRAQRLARQAQGRYLAAIRTLSKEAKAKIQQIRKDSGVDAAIKAARAAR